jgi:hypothetical protein
MESIGPGLACMTVKYICSFLVRLFERVYELFKKAEAQPAIYQMAFEPPP